MDHCIAASLYVKHLLEETQLVPTARQEVCFQRWHQVTKQGHMSTNGMATSGSNPADIKVLSQALVRNIQRLIWLELLTAGDADSSAIFVKLRMRMSSTVTRKQRHQHRESWYIWRACYISTAKVEKTNTEPWQKLHQEMLLWTPQRLQD